MTHFTGDLVMKWTSLVDTALVPLMNDEVRQPVICCNNHVFCSNCIKVWLEKSSQCPTCRVAITPENPCREIIGATADFESSESDSVKRRLRKTRGELLLREYETTHCDAATASEEEASVVEFSDRAGVMVENPTQPTKRKCPPGLSISSPSKLSKLK
ncbi:RING-H2 finger protein ATL58-like [Sinocyclocheilus grahami]|uniref:RING-H2 finger protein ATL58-like n=1 Tax=Sinocyclocheilus grahami TaxID=75366 RepID=UPI0007AD085A|nr:PREDICTED: RING-H2 finger protein ATL58-like [Sinocyclocheilus grahami]